MKKNRNKKLKYVFVNRKNKKNDAQLLTIAGIIISIIIIVSSVASVSLSYVNKTVDKSTNIKDRFDSIRDDFGIALDDGLASEDLEDEEFVNDYFNFMKSQFVFAEIRHDHYFNAELIERIKVNNEYDGLKVNLNLRNKYDNISQEVYYHIK